MRESNATSLSLFAVEELVKLFFGGDFISIEIKKNFAINFQTFTLYLFTFLLLIFIF